MTAKTKAWVTDWPDERSSALSLTFDDGYSCHYEHLGPVLKEHGLKATFFVVSGWLDDPSTSKYAGRIGTWAGFQQLAIDGHEIGSHSVAHPRLTRLPTGSEDRAGSLLYELAESKRAIERHVPTRACTSIAYPYALRNRKVTKSAANYYIAARGIGNPFTIGATAIVDIMDADRKLKGLLPTQNRPVSLFNRWILTRKNRILQKNNAFFQKQGSALEDNSLRRLTSRIQTKAFGRGVWSLFVLHEVLPFDQVEKVDTFSPYPVDYFKPFAKWLAQQVKDEAVWVDTVSNVMKYLKERDTFVYRVIKEDAGRIELQIGHGLDKDTFNYPLTIDVLVPDTWKHVDISSQGDTRPPERQETWNYEGENYVRFNASPSGQTLTLDGS
ncbi:MAG: polysaccharide deacetylase family protein [Candidatus Lokiarchaeota archaeon]|nr:polysaccharide deacetylase family protein [Candidatus Lokiarchaeota archaeon]